MTLVYDVEGHGDFMVLIHGLGGSANTFEPQVSALRDRYTLVRPSLPGMGRSSSLAAQPFDQVVDSLLSLVTALRCDSAHVVGHSLGAIFALMLAHRAPRRVRTLTFLGPASEPSEPMQQGLRARAMRVRAEGMMPFADEYLATALGPNVMRNQPSARAYVREALLRCAPQVYATYCEELAGYRSSPNEQVTQPTLVVAGDADRVAPPAAVDKLSRSLVNARVQVLPDCGHWAPVEAPIAVTDLLRVHCSGG